jgi:hypothetical protein
MEQLTCSTTIDPRKIQINLTGFLESNTPKFMSELWKILLSAMSASDGIPPIISSDKVREILGKKESGKATIDYRNSRNTKYSKPYRRPHDEYRKQNPRYRDDHREARKVYNPRYRNEEAVDKEGSFRELHNTVYPSETDAIDVTKRG